MENVFSTYHPAVAFVFLACVLVFSMAAMQPVYVLISFAGAFATSCVTRGFKHTVRSLLWIVPMWLVVTVANPLFSAMGSTEVARFGLFAVYAESLLYGACSGGMLASVFLWFSSYSACMNSDHSLALFGNVAPVVTLMITQVMRLVPQFLSRGRSIVMVQDAVSAAAPRTKRQKRDGRLRVVSILMAGAWKTASSAAAMRARGYDCGARRTTYKRYRFAADDMAVVAVIALFAAVNAVLAYVACSQYRFYPTASVLVAWWGYVPYALMMLIPVALYAKEWWLWRSLK
ncbi:MAG: hypothetical protein ACLTQI_08945 [Slackia sp.]